MSWIFLGDWKFWSFFVALIALVLSQLPPIKLWFQNAKLDLELYSRVLLMHKVGNPNVQLHIILTNSGGRKVRIKSVNLEIERDGTKIMSLEAQNYVADPQDNQSILFTPFTLFPDDEWSYSVNFLNYFGREEEKKYRSAEKKLKDFIRSKNKENENREMVRGSDDLAKPFKEIFDSKFIWHAGEFRMKVNVITDDSKMAVSRSFRLTIYESQSEELVSIKSDFNAGDGIFWDSGNYLGLVLQIEEVNG